jgi:AcrR family transcriptional regulator
MTPARPLRGSGDSYHHGDLRNALIIAAANLIEERGSEDFALVEAARKAGVSSAAPYRHFRDKDDLLNAVAELGFYALSLQMETITARTEAGSIERITELGKGYLAFVTGHPAFYTMMWGERGSRMLDDTELQLRANGFRVLVSAVDEWCDREGLRNLDPLDLSLKLWAMALGLASLTINGQLVRFDEQVEPEKLLVSSTLAFLEGVRQGR